MGSSESPYIIATSEAMGQALYFLEYERLRRCTGCKWKNANTRLKFIHETGDCRTD